MADPNEWDDDDDPSDEDAADVLSNGHPKSRPPFAPDYGSAPGANGQPTTGPYGGQDSDF